MRASQVKGEATFPNLIKPCVICGTPSLHYGYTHLWGNLCSRTCSDEQDRRKYERPTEKR